MASNHKDKLKKRTAQVLNNSAKAVIDLQQLYDEFKPHHPEMALILGQAMIEIAQAREKVIVFVNAAWYIDEEQIMKYMG